jgi:glycosyltransferase involved in cell wall biosynthesis
MTIGIDARFFGPRGKGLGRYTQKLIEELEKIDTQNDFVIFLRRENFDEYQPQNPRFKKVLSDYRWYTLAEQIFLPGKICRQKTDLMHFPHFNVPIFYFGRYIVTIHDLILRHFATKRASTLGPLTYWFKHLAYRLVIWLAIWRAQKIITVSQYVKQDIIKCFGVVPEKIIVTYEGAAETIKSQDLTAGGQDITGKYKIKKPYLLYVGNAYPHKNLEQLIGAFGILLERHKKDLQLVLVGEDDYFYQRLRSQNNTAVQKMVQSQKIIFTGFVPDKQLAVLYQNAKLYVFPSLCEGFGLPPLEAMAHGLPVAASFATCLPEILGEAAIYFDAQNCQDIAEKIKEVLENEGLRKKLISKGFEQIKKYSWLKMAKETLKIYGRVKFDTEERF